MSDIPTGIETVWHIQKRLIERGHRISLDGDLGPKTFWDSSETLKAILAELGGPVSVALSPVAASSLGQRVFIEVGHGPKPDGFDPGAVNSKTSLMEHTLNQVMASAISSRLSSTYGIASTIGDAKLSNYDSGRAAKGHDIMVSCHHNAASGPAQYALALYDDRRPTGTDKALAELVAKTIARELSIPSKGARGMSLSVLSGARSVGVPTAILVEPYFIHAQTPDNPAPAQMSEWSQRAGAAIADAIAAHLGVIAR